MTATVGSGHIQTMLYDYLSICSSLNDAKGYNLDISFGSQILHVAKHASLLDDGAGGGSTGNPLRNYTGCRY
jgi:hypothetical protein